jgi:hypothetical protein
LKTRSYHSALKEYLSATTSVSEEYADIENANRDVSPALKRRRIPRAGRFRNKTYLGNELVMLKIQNAERFVF